MRIACVIALVILGWSFAMNLGRAVGPTLLRRLDPGTAGTVGFLIRLLTLILSFVFALRLAGLKPRDARGRRRDHRGDPRSCGPADDRQPDRRNRAAERPPVPRGRPRAHARRRRGRPGRGDRGVARAALHDARQRRGPDPRAEQRRALGCGRAAPRAVGRRHARPPRRARQAQRGRGAHRGRRLGAARGRTPRSTSRSSSTAR